MNSKKIIDIKAKLEAKSRLGSVTSELDELIDIKDSDIDAILAKIEKGSLNFKNETISFDENDLLYNNGISTEEKQAWVYYQQNNKGIPMTNWSKYFIAKNQNAIDKLVTAGALFYSNGEYVPYPVFTWGNIYQLEDDLIANKDYIVSNYSQEIYDNHLKALAEVKPAMLKIDDKDEDKRPIISLLSKVAYNKNIFSISEVSEEYSDIDSTEVLNKRGLRLPRKKRVSVRFDGEEKYSLQQVFIKWINALDRKRYFDVSNPYDIYNYYILGSPISDIDSKLDASDRAEIKKNAREKGEALFSIFLAEVLTQKDREKLNRIWNSKYNGWSDLKYNRVPIGLETTSKFLGHGFSIRPEKREAIAYMSAVGAGILAYDVGVGKTISALLELASAIQQGKAKRALLVVPNPTYKNWIKEGFGGIDEDSGDVFDGILSHTGITINKWYNLGVSVIKKLEKNSELDKKVAENSITIVTYEGFANLGFSDAASNEFIDEYIDIMDQNQIDPDDVEAAEDESTLGRDYSSYDDMGSNLTLGKSKRDEGKSKEEYLKIIGAGTKYNTVADVDVLGFDHITIDEAHRCKNIFSGVKKDANNGAKNYLLSGSQSTTGIKAFFICNYIQRVAAKGKGNVLLLTATPFTNSPLEVYSMMSLVGYDHMQSTGLYNINDFFKMFVKPEPEYVVKYDGTVTVKDTIKSYTNRIILQKLIFTKINYKSGDELVPPLKRPIKINLPLMARNVNGQVVKLPKEKQVLTFLRMNEKQAIYQEEINNKLANITKDNFNDLFRYMGASQDNAFSPFAYKLGAVTPPSSAREFVLNSPKVEYAVECIRSVKKYHEANNQKVSGQVIYSDRGVRFFPMIKEYLLENVGFKKHVKFEGRNLSEVMIIAGTAMEKVDKEIIKEAFLAGIVKVIIGSSTIREGINLQTYGTTIYDLRPDWNPTDFRQLEGRIHRQKNKFGYVRICMPLVENSMDVFMFQKLEEKTSRINDIFYREGSSNMLDLSSLDPSEIKYALISNIGSLAKIDFGLEMNKALNKISILNDELNDVRNLHYDIDRKNKVQAELLSDMLNNVNKLEVWLSTRPYDWKTDPTKEQKIESKKVSELLTDLKDATTAKDFTTIVSLSTRLNNYNQRTFRGHNLTLYTSKIASYRVDVRDLLRKEKVILKPKGLSLDVPLPAIIDKVKKEYEAERLKYLYNFGKLVPTEGEESTYEPLSASELDRGVENMKRPPRRYVEIYNYIEKKKKELAIDGQPVKRRVAEFASLNYLLNYKMADIDPTVHELPSEGENPPQKIQCPPLDATGKRRIDDQAHEMIAECLASQTSTKDLHIDAEGNYTPERQELHNRLISEFKDLKPCVVQEKPICILTGGAPGSGKSTFLKRFAPWISSGNLYHIDADEVRAKLPEYEGWNASNTHLETKDLVNRLLDEIGDPCLFDMIYDGTMNKAANYKPLIKKLKDLGFIVFVIYIEVPKELSMDRAMSRYQRSGRYVPKFVIDEIYENGLEAFHEVLKMADGYVQVDGVNGSVIKKDGYQLPANRNYEFAPALSNSVITSDNKIVSSKANKMKMLKLKARALKLKLALKAKNN